MCALACKHPAIRTRLMASLRRELLRAGGDFVLEISDLRRDVSRLRLPERGFPVRLEPRTCDDLRRRPPAIVPWSSQRTTPAAGPVQSRRTADTPACVLDAPEPRIRAGTSGR